MPICCVGFSGLNTTLVVTTAAPPLPSRYAFIHRCDANPAVTELLQPTCERLQFKQA